VRSTSTGRDRVVTRCCRAGACEEIFTRRFARRNLENLRRKGLGDLERKMVALAAEPGLEGARVLEIGGGIGALQAELLDAGADRGEVVEIVAAYEPYARELARERGLEERTTFRVADVLEERDAVDTADIVLMNRVVCCTPDGVALAGRAAALARRSLVLSFPRDVVWLRAGARLMNAGLALFGRDFRIFVHPRSALVAAAEAEGMRLSGRGGGGPWEFAAFERP
jgi:magnesium-protoporphyrin O-methyltransferase